MKIDIVQKQAARKYKKTMTISMSGEGNFVIRAEEKAAFVANEPNAEKFLRLYIGPDEFIKRRDRYCLWHRDVPPSDLTCGRCRLSCNVWPESENIALPAGKNRRANVPQRRRALPRIASRIVTTF